MADGFKVPSIPVKSSKTPVRQPSENEEVIKERKSQVLVSGEDIDVEDEGSTETIAMETNAMETSAMETKCQPSTSNSNAKGDIEVPRQPEAPPPIPYTLPHWSGECCEGYSLLVIKNGVAVDTVQLKGKSHILFGRLPNCDVRLEHPSISRYHAVVQFKPVDTSSTGQEVTASKLTSTYEAGFYVYDLGSTHGTHLNKNPLNPRVYYRLRVGQMVKFGGSTRMFVLELSNEGQDKVEQEAEREIQDFSQQKQIHKAAEVEQAKRELERQKKMKKKEEEGVMWGMDYDFDMESEAIYNPDEVDPEREAYYKDDPKKIIRKFFEREDLDLEYESEETGQSYNKTFHVRLKLPIDTATGEPVYAEGTSKGKKKEAIFLCALDACRVLDGYDMLRVSSQGHKRKQKNWEKEDYYDSDEDTFLDRTGTVEKKRLHRMKRAGKIKDKAETFQSLKTKLEKCQKEIDELENSLERSRRSDSGGLDGPDSLESYMKTLDQRLSKSDKYEMRQRIHHMRKEEEQLLKLINVVRTPGTPEFKSTNPLVDLTRHTPPAGQPLPPHGRISTSNSIERKPLSKESSSASSKEVKSFVSLKERIEQAKLLDQQEEEEEESESDACREEKNREMKEEGRKEKGEPVTKLSLPRRRTSSTGSDNPLGSSPTASPTAKKARVYGPPLPPMPSPPPKIGSTSTGDERDSTKTHEDKKTFITWLPPEGQSGDGKTHLNEKFGY